MLARIKKLNMLEPFRDLNSLGDFEGALDRAFGAYLGGYYPAEIWEDGENVYVEVELPGLKIEDVNLSFEDGILRIEGEKKEVQRDQQVHLSERRYGKFVRTFHLPNVIDAENIQAKFVDGILSITCAKRPEVKPKKIEIKSS